MGWNFWGIGQGFLLGLGLGLGWLLAVGVFKWVKSLM